MNTCQAKLDAHYRAMTEFLGIREAREARDNAHISTSIIWYVRPGSPDADIIRLDAAERGLSYSVLWAAVGEVMVSG